LESSDFDQLTTQYNGHAVSFQYPAPSDPQDNSGDVNPAIQKQIAQSATAQDTLMHSHGLNGESGRTWVAYAHSSVFGLTTWAAMPVQHLFQAFLADSGAIMVYGALAVVLILALFFYLNRMSGQLFKAQDRAIHDPLTLLHNRRALNEKLPDLLRDSMREYLPLTVLFIDIDFFRNFNEKYGHECGDIALCEVARCLAQSCRRPMDLICRWGGEEFVAVLPHTPESAARQIAQGMLEAVRGIGLNVRHHQDVHVTVSIGIVVSTITSKNIRNDLVDMADKAMQKTKAEGRDRVTVYKAEQADHQPLLQAARSSNPLNSL